MKKSLLFCLLTLLSLSGFAQSGAWFNQASNFTPVNSGVRQISAVDSNIVWICAYDGDPTSGGLPRQDYSRTIDGGSNWVSGTVPITPSPTSWDWSSIYGLSDSIAWAGFFSAVTKHQGQIYRTTDAGTSWTRQGTNTYLSSSQSFLNNIYFWNASEGIATGDPITMASGLTFEIYITSDSGNTWTMTDTTHLSAIAPDEANQITHYTVVGDTIWWDSNYGRVFRSVDRGHHWTVSNTNLINFNGIIDICFYNHSGGGFARYYEDTVPTSNICVQTSDGGLTWSAPFFPNGDLFGFDIKVVPGIDSMMVSTGISSNSNYVGSSYSLDGGHNWILMEADAQRGVLGIADSLHMWCGGFSSSPTANGIFKWRVLEPVLCNDPNINSGITTVSDSTLCGSDSAVFHTASIYSPLNNTTFCGFSMAVSTADISGSLDPVSETSFIASFPFVFPAPDNFNNLFINNGAVINGTTQPYGLYYFTPVVFGNGSDATGTGAPVFLHDLLLDPNCTYSGTSVPIWVFDPNLTPCFTGIDDINYAILNVNSSMKDRSTLDVLINSEKSGVTKIQIVDITGRAIRSMECSVKEGSNHEYVNVESLAQGVYLIKAEMNGIKASNKIFKY